MSQSLKEAIAANPALADEFKVAIAKAVVEFAKSKGLDLTKTPNSRRKTSKKSPAEESGKTLLVSSSLLSGFCPASSVPFSEPRLIFSST